MATATKTMKVSEVSSTTIEPPVSIRDSIREERRLALMRWRKWVEDRKIPRMAELLEVAALLGFKNPTADLEHDMGAQAAIDHATARDNQRQERSADRLAPWGGDRKKLQAEILELTKRLRELERINGGAFWSKGDTKYAIDGAKKNFPRLFRDAAAVLKEINVRMEFVVESDAV